MDQMILVADVSILLHLAQVAPSLENNFQISVQFIFGGFGGGLGIEGY